MLTQVSDERTVAISEEIGRRLGIEPGDRLDWTLVEGSDTHEDRVGLRVNMRCSFLQVATTMHQDEILAEVWRHRDAYATEHHHRLAEMVADLRARQDRAHRKLIDRRDKAKQSSRDYTAERKPPPPT